MCIPLKSQTLSGNKIDYLRGFETVSYLLEGEFTHEDFLGHRGVLKVDHLNIHHTWFQRQTFNIKEFYKDWLYAIWFTFSNYFRQETSSGWLQEEVFCCNINHFFYLDSARYCPFWDRNLFCYVVNFDFARYCPFRDARLGENQGVAALGELAKVGLVTCFRCHGLAQQIQLVAVCTWNYQITITNIWVAIYIFREKKMMAPTYQELSADQVLVQNAVIQVQKVQVLVQVNETVLDLWCQSCAGSNCLPYDRQNLLLWVQVPEASNGKGVVVRVVAGVALGVSSPVRTITPTYYLGKGMIMIMIQIWMLSPSKTS